MDGSQNIERTERQGEVLDAALALLVEGADRFTMAGVARRASCSKETLYKWFGDRDGLLTAVVRWQASKVMVAPYDADRLDIDALRAGLEDFAGAWLGVVSGAPSIALNRVAASKPELGRIVLAQGRFAIGERVKPLLEAGRNAGLLTFADAEEAFRTLFGLMARDVQIRLLLGDALDLDAARISRDAALVAQQFLTLFGVTNPPAKANKPAH